MPHSTTPQKTTTIKGQKVDVASLEVVDYGRLMTKEPKELEKLLNASQMPGFFHLDLQNASGQGILTGLEEIYQMSEEYHGKPPEEKMKDLEVSTSPLRRWLAHYVAPDSRAFSLRFDGTRF